MKHGRREPSKMASTPTTSPTPVAFVRRREEVKNNRGSFSIRIAFVLVLVALALPLLRENGVSIQQAEAGSLAHHMKVGFGEHLGGTPVDLIMKDLYPLIAHQGIGKLIQKFLFLLKRLLKYQDVAGVTDVVMSELETHLFGSIGGANQTAWKKLRDSYEENLREWWVQTPEEPWSALKSGVWKSLLKLYTEEFAESARGNERVGNLMNKLVFDESMALISRWTDPDHIKVMRMRSSSQRLAALKRLQQFQAARGLVRGAVAGRKN